MINSGQQNEDLTAILLLAGFFSYFKEIFEVHFTVDSDLRKKG